MRIVLKVTAGPFAGRVFHFNSHDTFLVGRSKHAHLQLPPSDRTCSRIHFMIEINPPYCRLMDMGSNNGTHVNDQRVNLVELKHGDKIRAGRNILRIAVQSAAAKPTEDEPAPTAAPPQATPSATPLGTLPTTSYPATARSTEPTVSAAAPPQAVSKSVIGKYTLKQKLGQGGMGVVYLVEDADGSLAALKMIRPAVEVDPGEIERFLREAEILGQLQHPHIIGFRDMGESDGILYFVMDYVQGQDARVVVKQQGPLPAPRAAALTCQLLEALEYAHAKRFVHRDIKPSNLLIYEENGRELVKLADFGLARVYQASKLSGLTMYDTVGGTPCYMAPEQLLNFRDSPPSADQYSAAATLYYLLTGKFVYDAPPDMYRVFAKILNEEPIPIRQRRADLPAGLAEVIHRALLREPSKRYPGVAGFRKALEPFMLTET